jgi:hypothetical protein
MAGEIKLPFVGQVKSTWAWGGAGVVALIVGVAYYRKHQAAAAGSGTTAGTDANTAAAASAIDPETGLPAGSAADEAALEQLQSSGGYGSDYGDGDYYGTVPVSYAGATPNTGPGTFTDNAYWLQYAEQNVTGYSAAQIQAALSAYLAGAKLNTTQYTIYQIALGVAGPPPQPPATPPAPQPQGGTTPGTTKVSGQVHGAHLVSATDTSLAIAWTATEHATGYKITVIHSGHQDETETISSASTTLAGLTPDTGYTIRIQAQPTAETAYTTLTERTKPKPK